MVGVLLQLFVAPGWAQASDDTPEPAPGIPSEPAAPPPLAPPPVVALSATMVWELRARPATSAPLTGIALQPGEQRVWLVADADGAVFRSPDAGGSWSLVLPATGVQGGEDTDDEAVLMDAEALRNEEVDTTADEVDDTEPDDPAASSAVETDLGDAAEAAAHAAETSSAVLTAEGRAGARGIGAAVWFDPSTPGLALVGRDDGLWRSVDGGDAWSQVLPDASPGAFLRAGPAVLAGGDGVRVSLDDGASWIEVVGPLADTRVFQLAEVGGRVFAATDAGLYASSDSLHWGRVVEAGADPVFGIVPDPDWPGGLWLATDEGLLRSDDGGATFAPGGRQPLPALRRILHLGDPGHLLAVSAVDGVWESLDGGMRWVPVSRLLTDPVVYDVALVGRRPVVAGRTGVWELVSPRLLGEEGAAIPRGLPLGDTVGVALHRGGLDLDVVSLADRAAAYRLTPKLVAQAYYQRKAGRDASFFEEDTIEGHDRRWFANVQLCWGACDTLVTYEYGADLEDLVADNVDDVGLYVVDGEVYVDDDASVIASAANVAESVSRYRVALADQVSGAWLARNRLASEGALVGTAPLRDQVLHTLQIQELDARLDAWTGGAFTASFTRSEKTP